MRIEIYSDTVCPWCYIGKRHLERALERRPDLAPGVVWRAFQLNPDMPASGMDRRAYIEAKFGGAERAREVYDRVARAGEAAGIAFAFDAIARTPNTVDSHRLIRWAADQPGGQDPVVEALFRGYFLRGLDIGDRDVLATLAGEAGLDEAAAREFLASDAQAHAVRAEDVRARQLGIAGVPFFLVEGRFGISGAQPPEALLEAFSRIEAAAAAAPPAP